MGVQRSRKINPPNPVRGQAKLDDEFLEGAARSFFAHAWSGGEDELGDGVGPSEVLGVMPRQYDPAAHRAAKQLLEGVVALNRKSLPEIYALAEQSVKADRYGRGQTVEDLGFYAASQAMGSGVGMEEFGDTAKRSIRIPSIEFTYFDLDEWPSDWKVDAVETDSNPRTSTSTPRTTNTTLVRKLCK